MNASHEIKRSMNGFAREFRNDVRANGWDRERVVAEVRSTCDPSEWFILTREEKRTLRRDDETCDVLYNALREELADAILAG